MTGTPPRRQTGDRICPVKHLPRVKRTAGLKPPRTRSPWFRHDRLAERAGRLNQLRGGQSRLSRGATKEQSESKPPHTRKARTRPSSPDTRKRFRHDQLAERAGRLNQLQGGQSQLSRTATKKQPESKPPHTRKPEPAQVPQTRTRGFDTTHSLTLAGRLNQHQGEQSQLSRTATKKQPESKPPHTRKARTRPSSPDTHKRFRHDRLANARRPAQPTSGRTKPVEPGREERAPRVETTGGQTTNPAPVVFRPW